MLLPPLAVVVMNLDGSGAAWCLFSANVHSERKRTENRLLAAALKDEAQAVATLHAMEVEAEREAKRALADEVCCRRNSVCWCRQRRYTRRLSCGHARASPVCDTLCVCDDAHVHVTGEGGPQHGAKGRCGEAAK